MLKYFCLAGLILLGVATNAAHAVVIDPSNIVPYNFRDNRQPNSVNFRTGDSIATGFSLNAPLDVLLSTTADIEQNGLVQALPQFFDRPVEFGRSNPYNADLTGDWTLNVRNGGDTTTKQIRGIGNVESLGFVTDLTLTPNGLTPTLGWNLPAGVDFNTVQIGLFDDVNNARIPIGLSGQLFRNLPVDATSYTFDPGILEDDGRYVARVILNKTDANGVLSRSLSFINFTTGAGLDIPVFLPSVDENGVFNFDLAVSAATPVALDPFVATGYIFSTGDGDPNFRSITLPVIAGDSSYILRYFDGSDFVDMVLAADTEFLFPLLGGVDSFTILGIDPAAGLDPFDVTAFAVVTTFIADGRFTGTMTPITTFVDDIPSVPEPGTLFSIVTPLVVLIVVHARRRSTRGARATISPRV